MGLSQSSLRPSPRTPPPSGLVWTPLVPTALLSVDLPLVSPGSPGHLWGQRPLQEPEGSAIPIMTTKGSQSPGPWAVEEQRGVAVMEAQLCPLSPWLSGTSDLAASS
jgi:hypothetical protein